MFKIKENVPSIYVDESRDFQLFCSVFDYVNNGVKFDIDSIVNIYDPFKCNDRMIHLLCSKIGFFTKKEFDTNALRHILSAFPYLIKYKGSRKAIEAAVAVVLKINNSIINFKVNIDNVKHNIEIMFTEDVFDLTALDELLKYIIPIGYTYSILIGYSTDEYTSNLDAISIVKSYVGDTMYLSSVASAPNYQSDFIDTTYRYNRTTVTDLNVNDLPAPEKTIKATDSYIETSYTYYEIISEEQAAKIEFLVKQKRSEDIDNYVSTLEATSVVGASTMPIDDDGNIREISHQIDYSVVNDELENIAEYEQPIYNLVINEPITFRSDLTYTIPRYNVDASKGTRFKVDQMFIKCLSSEPDGSIKSCLAVIKAWKISSSNNSAFTDQ